MSRIGKQSIEIPAKVQVAAAPGKVTVTGPLGTLDLAVPAGITVAVEGKLVKVGRAGEDRRVRAHHGTIRARIAKLIRGVLTPYEKSFEINGKGWRCEARGAGIALSVGFSHPVVVEPEPGIKFTVTDQTHFKLAGIDAEQVGRVAARVRDLRPPEPYQGNGIRFTDEHVRRKVGKKSV